MHPTFQAIRLPEKSSLKCWYGLGRSFSAYWHFHPEIEIMYVEHSRGLRIVGDNIARFREGDLVLLGPDLPHVWLNDPTPRPLGHARAVVIQFLASFLGREFWATPEFIPVSLMIERSRHGIVFNGPDVEAMAELLLQAPTASGPERVLLLLNILVRMAHSTGQTVLCSSSYTPRLNARDARRVATIRRYVDENFLETIVQPAAAALVRMSSTAFSHYFRQKMGCTFSSYVNQVRISRAIHLMVEEEMTISEACFASGFNNLSNFNRRFLAIKKMPPSAFLRQLDRTMRPKVGR